MKPTNYTTEDFDHSPLMFYYEITQACDLVCKHCRASAQEEPAPDELSTEQSMMLSDQVASFPRQPILVCTGGDPLKRADLFDLIGHARSHGLQVALTPSATPLATLEWNNLSVAAGLRGVLELETVTFSVVCGSGHSSKLSSEWSAQAYEASARAVTFLAQEQLTLSAVVAQVAAEKCASCLICVRSCPYAVPRINAEGVSEIDPALCHGCGICAAECPAKAIELNWYEDDQIMCKIEALLEGVM